MNTNNKHKKLFQDFNPASLEDWINKATVDLKGADFERRLVWKNNNGIKVQPFYTTISKDSLLKGTGTNSAAPVNYRRIRVTDENNANKEAIKAIEEGMTGVLFEMDRDAKVAVLLKGINPAEVNLSFVLSQEVQAFAKEYKLFLEDQGIDKNEVSGYIDTTILDHYLTTGVLTEQSVEEIVILTEEFSEYPQFKTLNISGRTYLDAGSNQVQEIAYTLNSMVFFIEKLTGLGVADSRLIENLHISLGISSDYFIEIAKFRAFNHLLYKVIKKYTDQSVSIPITAKTSLWSKSVTDAHGNMLRATTEAMSALLGNANGVEIDPYNTSYESANDFSKRIAGNIVTILREESYFGKVANPTDGSYYIEELTTQLANNSLELFKLIEQEGGFFKAVEQEIIQRQISEIKLNKIKSLSQRRQAMVGVNKYPNLMESVDYSTLNNRLDQEQSKWLRPRRAGLELEYIRYNTEDWVKTKGIRPVVEIVSFGHLTMRKARAAFAFDFMGISGYDIMDEVAYDSATAAALSGAKSNTNIVVMCSSDQDYSDHALEFVKTFREVNPSKILLLAGNPSSDKEKLTDAGLDGFIHVKSDIFQTLNQIHEKLSRTVKPLEI